MMRSLERLMPPSEIAEMVDRTMNFYEYQTQSTQRAREYWQFVLKSYAGQGYESAEVFEIMCAADEAIQGVKKEIEEMSGYGR